MLMANESLLPYKKAGLLISRTVIGTFWPKSKLLKPIDIERAPSCDLIALWGGGEDAFKYHGRSRFPVSYIVGICSLPT